MKRYIQILHSIFIFGALASAAEAGVANFHAKTDDRHKIEGHGYFQTGHTETFIISSDDRQGRRLTPRVERWFHGEGTIREGNGVYTFTATYKIESANNTTIFQLLNHDKTSDDKHHAL